MKKLFSILAAAVMAVNVFAATSSVDIANMRNDLTTAYLTEETEMTVDGVVFLANAVCKNTKNTPTGWAGAQLLQMKKSGAGTITNKEALSLVSLHLVAKSTSALDVKAGATTDALESLDLTEAKTTTVNYKDAGGNDAQDDTYLEVTLDLKGAKYVQITTKLAAYIYEATLTYEKSAVTGRTFDGTEVLYLNAGAVDWWQNANAEQHALVGEHDVVGVACTNNSNYIGFTIPAGTYETITFTRNDPSTHSVWNQTGAISLEGTTLNAVVAFENDKAEATWGTFDPEEVVELTYSVKTDWVDGGWAAGFRELTKNEDGTQSMRLVYNGNGFNVSPKLLGSDWWEPTELVLNGVAKGDSAILTLNPKATAKVGAIELVKIEEPASYTIEITTDGTSAVITPSDEDVKYFFMADWAENFEGEINEANVRAFIEMFCGLELPTKEAYDAFVNKAYSGVQTVKFVEQGFEVGDDIAAVACVILWDGTKAVIGSNVALVTTTVKEATLEPFAATITAGETNGVAVITPTDKTATYQVLATSTMLEDLFGEELPKDPTECFLEITEYGVNAQEYTGDQNWDLLAWIKSTYMPVETEGEWTIIVVGVDNNGKVISTAATGKITVAPKEYTETIELSFDKNGLSAKPSGDFAYACNVLSDELVSQLADYGMTLENYIKQYIGYMFPVNKTGNYTAALNDIEEMKENDKLVEGKYYAFAVGFDMNNYEQLTKIEIVEFIYSTETGINNIEAAKAVKTVVNGQLVIMKGGKSYNAQGAEL